MSTEAQLRGLAIGQRAPRTEAQLRALKEGHDARRQPYPRERRIWYGIIQRCTQPDCKAFKDYGGRGIYVCMRWLESFDNFIADMKPAEGREIDRRDNNGPYSPDNCHWTDSETNNNNRRNNFRFEHNGMNLTLMQWSRHTDIPRWTIKRRLDAGRTPSEILQEFGFPG